MLLIFLLENTAIFPELHREQFFCQSGQHRCVYKGLSRHVCMSVAFIFKQALVYYQGLYSAQECT